MEFLTRDELLALAGQKPACEDITIKMPDGTVRKLWIQGLTGTQRDRWEESLVRGRGKRRRVDASNVRARLAVQCIVDGPDTRQRLYSDDDAATIGKLPSPMLGVIYEACQRLSGTSDEDLDELEQASAGAAGSGSPSSSPSS